MTWFLTGWVGFALVGFAALLALREHCWLRNAYIGHGTVIELVTSNSDDGPTYQPRVRFAAPDGSQHEFTRGYGSNPAGFSVGQQVLVACDSRSYSDGRILTFGQRFGFAVIVGSVGLAVLSMASLFLLGRTIVSRIYLQEPPVSAFHGGRNL